ncbi:hypothetical protein SAMN05192583_0896 [Sphingomonas gellani]|uniref:Tip attachment protein J domain-containing protein n=1 Tax=Sphingomonas gellani TaxID=1166340 RepID=A0A1H7ZXM7_9SPHN|nr:hypothetical protein [Sphingomonas gellani]SEM63061.1 hypothetical protein SAMN05192583_0896 [Sphingomonas gellani]
MSKFLATAAVVVGAVALAATGVGAAASAGLIGTAGTAATATTAATAASFAGLSATTLTSVATLAGVAAAGLSFGASALAPKPSQGGSQTSWKADPQAGIPYAMGRTYVSGNIVYRKAWGKDNQYQTLVTVLSGGGPHAAIEQMFVDKEPRAIGAGAVVNIPDYGYMWAGYQLGATPEASALTRAPGAPTGWSADCKLSGYAATVVTLKFDTKGDHTLTSTPDIGWVGRWACVYDPRRDSTYPGGSGAHRINDERTWEWSQNPYLHALTWLVGRRANGKVVLGVGAPVVGIIMAQFVEGANVADANGWKLGGVVYSTDDKWNAFKQMLQAGGGEPLRLGAQIGCLVNTPRVSLATITVGDVVGEASVQATQSRRDRINAIIPRYRSEANDWTVVAGSPVVVADYVTFDRRQRQKEVEYSLVQDLTQSQQLARYDIENAREFGPVTLPLKLRWMGYRPGDVVTATLPELGLVNQDLLLLQRGLSPQDGTVTMTARSETAGKHPFALGQTGTPPATPGVSGPALIPVPGASAWSLAGGMITGENGATRPVLLLSGAADSDVISGIVVEYRESTGQQDAGTGWLTVTTLEPKAEQLTITDVKDGGVYQVAVSYRKDPGTGGRLILGPVTAGQTQVPWQDGVVGPGKPEDNADVTRDHLPDAWHDWTGKSGVEVVSDLNAAIAMIAAEQMRSGVWRGETDRIVYADDGRPIRVEVEALGSDVDGVKQFVAFLKEVDSSAKTSKFLFSARADGSIVGIEGIAGGGFDQLSFVASRFLFVDENGGNPINALTYEGGVWRLKAAAVERLWVNTAVVPARAKATGPVQGTFSSTSGDPLPLMEVLRAVVTLAEPGWIDIDVSIQQGFTSTPAPWHLEIQVNGHQLDESPRGGVEGTSGVQSFGSYYASAAGDYVVTAMWQASTAVTLAQRAIRANGQQYTV